MEKFLNLLQRLLYTDGKLNKKNTVILCVLLVALAGIVGFGIKGLMSMGKDKGIDDNSNSFVTDNITFNRNKDGNIAVNDVVIFKRDNAISGYLIKRVIAVGGQTVNIDGNGAIYVNDQRYETDKPYYPKDVPMPVKVPEGQLFVIGDSGDESADSRRSYIGFVNVNEVEGIAAK